MNIEQQKAVVWYIECRSKTPDSNFAPAKAASMGSGVVVAIEQYDEERDEHNQPFSPPKLKQFNPPSIKHYLLTCAHVVRRYLKDDNGNSIGLGELHDEILCFNPRNAYIRTYEGRRRLHEAEGIWQAAGVSELSPLGKETTPIFFRQLSEEEQLAGHLQLSDQNDWVLLDIKGNTFDNEAAVPLWRADGLSSSTFVNLCGYPNGAGDEGKPGAWGNAAKFPPHRSNDLSPTGTSAPGVLDLRGDDAAPGMSGGPIFTQDGELAGIHRRSVASTMSRISISAATILRHLGRQNRFPAKATDTPPPRREPMSWADRKKEFKFFEEMLAGRSRYKMLWVEGYSQFGKTFLLTQFYQYALSKGMISVNVDLSGGTINLIDLHKRCLKAARQLHSMPASGTVRSSSTQADRRAMLSLDSMLPPAPVEEDAEKLWQDFLSICRERQTVCVFDHFDRLKPEANAEVRQWFLQELPDRLAKEGPLVIIGGSRMTDDQCHMAAYFTDLQHIPIKEWEEYIESHIGAALPPPERQILDSIHQACQVIASKAKRSCTTYEVAMHVNAQIERLKQYASSTSSN